MLIIIIGVNGEAKHTEYYDKLGVSPTADVRAIKKGKFSKNYVISFEKLAKKIFEKISKRLKNFCCHYIQIKIEMILKPMLNSWNSMRFTKF